MRDPYEVLGVKRDANPDEIKSAYRRMARRFHPDVNPDDPQAEEKFKEVGAAYAILSDADRKARFDRFGTTDEQPSDPFFGGGGGFGDIFDMFFGGMGQGQGARRSQGRNGDDIQISFELNLKEVLTGVQRVVEVDRSAQCDACNCNGTEGGGKPDSCGTCRGSGQVSSVRNTFIGQVRTSVTCPTCAGKGVVIKNPCHKCKGSGLMTMSEKVTLNVPAGVESGATMHLPGQGSEGVGMGRPGDLYVVLNVVDDGRFERRGQTLYTLLDTTFAQAALGDQVEIEGVDQTHDVEIPAGAQPGQQISIRGGGLPPLHGGRRGDLVVQLSLKVPTKVSDAEAKLIRELAELRGEPVPKGQDRGGLLGGLFGKRR